MSKDLTGKIFGEWTVLTPSDKPYYYLCRCSCGIERDVNASTLRLGKSTSCGHESLKTSARLRAKPVAEKAIGKRYGRLVVTGYELTSRRTTFICKCDCGNTTRAIKPQLDSGKKRSCGCLKSEVSSKSIENTYKSTRKSQQQARIDGTIAFTLNQKTSINSKTGHKGVSKMTGGKYRAYINVARKQIYLGTFNKLSDAIDARKTAEEKYHKPVLEKYDKLNKDDDK